MSSNRGHIVAVAVVTKRIKPLTIEGKKVQTVGIPMHWGFKGLAKPGYLANTLTPVRGRREFADAGIQVVPRESREGIRGERWHCNHSISNASPPPRRRSPQVRDARHGDGRQADRRVEVHRLQGVPDGLHGMERPARRSRRSTIGVYDNPRDLTEHSWTVMRFSEYENPAGDLEWLIRKDGCMHCEDPGCLKACPSPGAIVQYTNGIVDFHEENCIGCGYCVTGCPFNVPRISKQDHRAYKCTLCSDRVAVGLEPACVKTCPTGAIMFGTKEDMKAAGGGPHRGPEGARLPERRAVRPGRRRRHACDVRAAPRRQADALSRLARESARSVRWSRCGRASRSRWRLPAIAVAALAGFFHYTRIGPNEVTEEDELEAQPRSRRGRPARNEERSMKHDDLNRRS